MLCLVLSALPGGSETYLAGQIGVTFPNSLSNVNFVSPLSPVPTSISRHPGLWREAWPLL